MSEPIEDKGMSKEDKLLLSKNNTGRPDFSYISSELERRFFRLLYAIGVKLNTSDITIDKPTDYSIPSAIHTLINKIEAGFKVRIGYHDGTTKDAMRILKDTCNADLIKCAVCSENLEVLLDELEREALKIGKEK